jgi:hypothetical protein
VGLELLLNSTRFTAGDLFLFQVAVSNECTRSVVVDEYVILEALGLYWFWPSWSQAPDARFRYTLPPRFQETEVILEFIWPAGVGALEGIRFWGALTRADTYEVLALDSVEWSYY